MENNGISLPKGTTLVQWAFQNLNVPAEQIADLDAAMAVYEQFETSTAQGIKLSANLQALLRSTYDLVVAGRGPSLLRSLEGRIGEIFDARVKLRAICDRLNEFVGPESAGPLYEDLEELDHLIIPTLKGLDLALNRGDDGEMLMTIAPTLSDRLAALAVSRPRKAGVAKQETSPITEFMVASATREKTDTNHWKDAARSLREKWRDADEVQHPYAADALKRLCYDGDGEKRSLAEMGNYLSSLVRGYKKRKNE